MIGLAKVFKEKNSFPLEKGCSWSVAKFARDLVAGLEELHELKTVSRKNMLDKLRLSIQEKLT